MGIKEFIRETKKYGLKVSIGNELLDFTKWFIRAKRIQVTYFKRSK